LKQLRKRLTYANVMSSIAVFLVLGGGAAIAANQLGKNTVGPKQLKKNAVTAAKIKNNAVTAAKLQNGAVTGAKINTASLGTVPTAGHANTAGKATTAESATTAGKATTANTATTANSAGTAGNVNGQTVVKIFTLIPNGSLDQTIASFAGFTIKGDCTGNDVANLVLTPPNETTDLKAFGNGNEEAFFSHAQEGESAELSEENDRGETSFSAATLSGTVISGNIGYEDPDSFVDTASCAFYGQVLVTA
jgi:hypothetical protein